MLRTRLEADFLFREYFFFNFFGFYLYLTLRNSDTEDKMKILNHSLKYDFSLFDFHNSMKEGQISALKQELTNEGFKSILI